MSQSTDAPDLPSALLRERYRLLARQIPTLYLIVVVCTTPVIGLILTRGGGLSMAAAPALMVVVVIARMIHWRRARIRVDAMSDDAMRREMRRTAVIGPAIGFIHASVCIAGGLTLDVDAKAITLVTVWMCTIASSFCLLTLPRTAYAVVFASGAPLCAIFLYMGEPLLMVAGGLVVALACLVITVIKQQHDAFSEHILTRALAEQRHELASRRTEEVSQLANSDDLTRLPNRRRFMTELAERAQRSSRPFAVALLDLDGFKPINDIYGHAAGDSVLIETGRRLEALMAGQGVAARFGGDEFCLLIEGDERQALAVARLARAAIGEPCALSEDVIVRVDCCVGVAAHDGVSSGADLMEHADATLYRCKNRGGGAVALHSDRQDEPNLQRAGSSRAA